MGLNENHRRWSVSRLLDRSDAIRLINPAAMEDKAFKYIYGRRIQRDIRRPLMWLFAVIAKYQRPATAGKLNELVCEANDCCVPTARKHVKRAVDLQLISEESNGRETYYFLSDDQFQKARELINLLKIIPKVICEQEKNPVDPIAGKDLIARQVYYNIISTFDEKGEIRS
jgi:hypothetical protein